jgi:hypothetical protein
VKRRVVEERPVIERSLTVPVTPDGRRVDLLARYGAAIDIRDRA